MKPTLRQIQELLPTTRQLIMMTYNPKGLARNKRMRLIKVRGCFFLFFLSLHATIQPFDIP